MTRSNLEYYLALHHMDNIGPKKTAAFLAAFDSLVTLFSCTEKELRMLGVTAKDAKAITCPDWQKIEADLAWQAKHPWHHILCPLDEPYPDRLRQIASPPLILYIKGNLAALHSKQIAIIGSRHPTESGLKIAHDFAHELAKGGLTITSGLALGIDAASHKGALSAKGLTIGVAGTGLNHYYPQSNRALIHEIINNDGAYISEFSLDTPPMPPHFPRRNRIISGLSHGVLVIEAALKSGSLITAYAAMEQGRDVFAIPGSIHHPLKRGCHALIKQGAKLIDNIEDIFEELGMSKINPLAIHKPPLSAAEQAILQLIGYEIVPLDAILCNSSLKIGEVSSILLQLELSNHIQSVYGGYRAVNQ